MIYIYPKSGNVRALQVTSPIGQLGSSFSLSECKSYPSRMFGRAKFLGLPLRNHVATP